MTVRIQTADFDVSAEIAALRRSNPKVGAVASFIGVVRDVNEGDAVAEMTLEHYPGHDRKGDRRDHRPGDERGGRCSMRW